MPRDTDRSRARRRVVLVAYPGVQALDVVGPLEVFSIATRYLARVRPAAPAPYEPLLVAMRPEPLQVSAGYGLVPARTGRTLRGPIDTLLVAGGEGSRAAARDAELLAWLRRRAPGVRRLGSVCTGTFVLAAAGLLHGRRVTTHWFTCDELQRRHPELHVDPDPIFVRDGDLWTSAGVTAGMDLALAMVEEDLGREIALQVARWLVLFLKRPGGQSQFSAQLGTQLAERHAVRAVQDFVADHVDEDLSVERLARRAGMSPRHFARVFRRDVGTTPARFVEASRVEAARRRLEETEEGVERIAADCGFGSAETLRRAFLRTLRVGPTAYRSRFRSTIRAAAAAGGAS